MAHMCQKHFPLGTNPTRSNQCCWQTNVFCSELYTWIQYNALISSQFSADPAFQTKV
jgi:hypothetical protein